MISPTAERQSTQVGVRVCTLAECPIPGSEFTQTVEVQENQVPGGITDLVFVGMSNVDPTADDDGKFDVSFPVPDGQVDVYEWRVDRVQPLPTDPVGGLLSGTTTSNTIAIEMGQTSNDIALTMTVVAVNLVGNGTARTESLTLWRQNDAPVGQDIALSMDEDTALSIDFSQYVSDADGEPLHIEFLKGPSSEEGVLTNNGLGWTFTPTPEFDTDGASALQLIYEVVEDSGRKRSDPYTLTIDIIGQTEQVPFLTAAYSNEAFMNLGLLWGAAEDAGYYEVHWQLPNGTTDVFSPVNANLWTETPDGVVRPYGDYTFTVVACTPRGICTDVNTAPSRTLVEPVPRVGDFSITPDNDNAGAEDYTLRWPDKTKAGVEWPNLAEYVVTEDGVEVYRGLNLQMAFSKYDQPGTYDYHVRACNAQACESQGKAYSWVVRPVGPERPVLTGGQVVNSASDLALQLNWTQPAGRATDRYEVVVTSNTGVWTESVSLGAGVNQYSVTGIDGNAKPFDAYTAEVSACRTIGGEELCSSTTQVFEEPRPSAPTNHVVVPSEFDEGFNERLVSQWTFSPEPNVYFYRHTIIQNGGEYRPPEDIGNHNDTNGFSLHAQPGTYRVDVAACNYSGVCSSPATATAVVDQFIPTLPAVFTVAPVDINTYRLDFLNTITIDGAHPRASHHVVRWESEYYGSYGNISTQSEWESVRDIRLEAGETSAAATRSFGDPLSTYRFAVQACSGSSCSDWSPYVVIEELTPDNIHEAPRSAAARAVRTHHRRLWGRDRSQPHHDQPGIPECIGVCVPDVTWPRSDKSRNGRALYHSKPWASGAEHSGGVPK